MHCNPDFLSETICKWSLEDPSSDSSTLSTLQSFSLTEKLIFASFPWNNAQKLKKKGGGGMPVRNKFGVFFSDVRKNEMRSNKSDLQRLC